MTYYKSYQLIEGQNVIFQMEWILVRQKANKSNFNNHKKVTYVCWKGHLEEDFSHKPVNIFH